MLFSMSVLDAVKVATPALNASSYLDLPATFEALALVHLLGFEILFRFFHVLLEVFWSGIGLGLRELGWVQLLSVVEAF